MMHIVNFDAPKLKSHCFRKDMKGTTIACWPPRLPAIMQYNAARNAMRVFLVASCHGP